MDPNRTGHCKNFIALVKYARHNPICHGPPGPDRFMGGGGAQRARIEFKGSRLFFDLENLCMHSGIKIDFL